MPPGERGGVGMFEGDSTNWGWGQMVAWAGIRTLKLVADPLGLLNLEVAGPRLKQGLRSDELPLLAEGASTICESTCTGVRDFLRRVRLLLASISCLIT